MFFGLVLNEITKMIKKRRFQVVLAIVFILMVLFSYAEHQAVHQLTQQMGTTDWHVRLQQEVTNDLNQLHSPFLSSAEKASIQASVSEATYELSHNIDPYSHGAPGFMRTFMDEGILLLIPMLVVVIASDMVSSEQSTGTIKMLLTRGVARSRVLLSKFIALVLLIALLMGAIAIFAYGVSGIFFGYRGFGLPVLLGFHVSATGYVSASHVYTIPQWQYLFMTFGLGFYACFAVACLAFMVSTLVRSTASGMGIMMAALIAGALLSSLASTWTAAKYLPVVNLQLSGYLNGSPPPITGMTFSFSVLDLLVTSIVALIISFVVFVNRDIMG